MPNLTGDSKEPLLTAATVTSAATAILAALVAFGLKLTADQQTAVVAVVAVAAPIVAAVYARRRVYSPATVNRLMAARREPDA